MEGGREGGEEREVGWGGTEGWRGGRVGREGGGWREGGREGGMTYTYSNRYVQ